MKKYFLTAILSLLVATVFTSCGDNDIIEGTEKPSSELKVWVEPYHIKGASLHEWYNDALPFRGREQDRW